MAAKGKPTRAEQIREKREGRPRMRKSSSKRRAETNHRSDFPPVFVRGELAAPFSGNPRKDSHGRRRFDIALNGQGAEMRLPSIPRITIGWRFLSAFLVGALGFLIYLFWTAPIFNVDSIQVKGISRLSNEELNAVADVIGKSIIFVDPEKVEQDLNAAFPELENISVETEVPNKVLVSLVERKPVLVWQQDGQTFWIDQDGMAYLPHGDAAPSIKVQGSALIITSAIGSEDLVDGESQDQKIPVELVDAILALSQVLPENSPLTYDELHGLGWFDPRGWQVYFGKDGQDMELKWKVYWKTFKRLKNAGIIPAVISVEHLHAPYYRLEQ
jgi:cell division protein FtsQ